MIRKILITLALAIGCATSFAATSIDTTGLSDAQIAELKAQAAKAVADTAKKATEPNAANQQVSTVMTMASTWGQQAAVAAEGFAKAMGIAARELNVTVNDFLKSDAGKLTAVVIIWKVAGASIMKAIFGVLLLTVGLTVIRAMWIRLFTAGYKEVPYSRLFGLWTGTKQVRITKSFSDLANDGEWLVLWIIIIATVILMLVTGALF